MHIRAFSTFYNNNTYKIGLDKNIWFIKGGKWVPLKEETILLKKEIENNKRIINLNNKLAFIGEINSIPAFILKREIRKKKLVLEIICTNDLSKKF